MRIKISADTLTVLAELNESSTAQEIWRALPIEGYASTWGDEIYFGIPVHLPEAEDAREVVELGDLAYWSPGHAFCLFFGPTPMSFGNEIRPASAVTVLGRIEGDPTVLRQVESGTRIVITQAN